MLRICTIALLTALVSVGNLTARIISVPADYASIQAGINASFDGDTVLVSSGTYNENINFNGHSIVLMSESGPDATILQPLNGYVSIISMISGEGAEAILSGFTLRGMTNECAVNISVGASPLIYGNKFTNNTGYPTGGIKIYRGDSPIISNNIFANCTAGFAGGGIYSESTSVTIESNIFCNNQAEQCAGAMWIASARHCSIRNNLIYSNRSHADGALFLYNSIGVDVYNNTIHSNTVDEGLVNGAGIRLHYSDSCRVYNNIITENLGYGLYIVPYYYFNSNTFNDVWGNTQDYGYATIPGEGSLSLDPLFNGGNPFDYHLSYISPCIDSGDPDSPNDPDGSRADMGALFPPIQGQYGYIAGTTQNSSGSPIFGAIITIPGLLNQDTTDADGRFLLGPFPGQRGYDIQIAHPEYFDTLLWDVYVNSNDTTDLVVVLKNGYHLIYGNLDGSPVPAVIGYELEIPAWGVTELNNFRDSIAWMHSPLATNDSVIIERLDGYFPDTLVGRWDIKSFDPPNVNQPQPGWTNQSLEGVADIQLPLNHQDFFWTNGDTTLICTYRMRVADDVSLIGDTLSPLMRGYHPGNGPMFWALQDDITTIYPLDSYPEVYFLLPSQVGFLNGNAMDSLANPINGVKIRIVNSYKSDTTDEFGTFSMGWLVQE